MSTAGKSSSPPVVKVTLPKPAAPIVIPDMNEHKGKTSDKDAPKAINGKQEPLPLLKGHMQQSRALTVPLPKEVNIPAGCLVELVEVKTVNGTKELKLRLVSKQENESVIKDTRTTVYENTTLGKPLSSAVNQPTTGKSVSLGKCTVNRNPYETTNQNVEPQAVAVSVFKNLPNQVSREKNGLKRTTEEIINLECDSVTPNKVPKTIFSSSRECNSGTKVSQSQSVAPPTTTLTRVPIKMPNHLHPGNIGANVSQRAADQRVNISTPQSRSSPQQRTNDFPQNVSTKKVDCININLKKEAADLSQQNSKPAAPTSWSPSAKVLQTRRPMVSVCLDKVSKLSFSELRAMNGPSLVKTPMLPNGSKSNVPPQTQKETQQPRICDKIREREVPEPESFPVISSVFSLSQQSENVQGSLQPLVMAALRGIVMDNNSAAKTQNNKQTSNTALVKQLPTLGDSAQKSDKNGPLLCTPHKTCESVKIEQPDANIQPSSTLNHVHVKTEKSCKQTTNIDKQCKAPDAKPEKDERYVSRMLVDSCRSSEPLQLIAKSGHDASPEVLTVSLKKVQVGVWKKSNRGLKLRLSKCKTREPTGSLNDYTVIYPMPLKKDQLVKRPGPNQPVVVLNHPKPRASELASSKGFSSNTGASKVAPKCRILKMRLSKVVGRKYEVKGCTVKVFS